MGSITAQEYIQKYPNDFQKVILSGTDVGDLRYLFLQWITSLSIKKMVVLPLVNLFIT